MPSCVVICCARRAIPASADADRVGLREGADTGWLTNVAVDTASRPRSPAGSWSPWVMVSMAPAVLLLASMSLATTLLMPAVGAQPESIPRTTADSSKRRRDANSRRSRCPSAAPNARWWRSAWTPAPTSTAVSGCATTRYSPQPPPRRPTGEFCAENGRRHLHVLGQGTRHRVRRAGHPHRTDGGLRGAPPRRRRLTGRARHHAMGVAVDGGHALIAVRALGQDGVLHRRRPGCG